MGKKKPPQPSAPVIPAPTPDDTAAKKEAADADRAVKVRRGAFGSMSIATSPLGDTSTPNTNAPSARTKLG